MWDALLRIKGQDVPLLRNQPVALGERIDLTTSEAFAPVRCVCGETSILQADVTYDYYDDDHAGYRDVWYHSVHVGQCKTCGAALQVGLQYTRRTMLMEPGEFIILDGAGVP